YNVLDLFFFFSSSRRHTRFSRDWSSDVCSSDLATRADNHVSNSYPPHLAQDLAQQNISLVGFFAGQQVIGLFVIGSINLASIDEGHQLDTLLSLRLRLRYLLFA